MGGRDVRRIRERRIRRKTSLVNPQKGRSLDKHNASGKLEENGIKEIEKET